MKLIKTLMAIPYIVFLPSAHGQGWVAEINLDLNHELYAYEKIDHASLTFSGVTVTGWSQTSTVHFVVRGNEPLSGDIDLSINGEASDPYNPADPQTKVISASYTGSYSKPCIRGFLTNEGETPFEQISMWIMIYPRMDISSFLQDCDKLTIASNTCSPSFLWEVSDDLTVFKAINGASQTSITITREELIAMGFPNPYGRKYFRVTGRHGTTSEIQPVDIYYSGPTASLSPEAPKCHGGNDGSVRIDIQTSNPGINDFVVTLLATAKEDVPLYQEIVADGTTLHFAGIAAGDYRVKIENNSNINLYGNCWAEYTFSLEDPEPVIVASAQTSDFNGYEITCDGQNNGSIEVAPSGGTGVYLAYQWIPEVSTTNAAEHLGEGTYTVTVKDSHACWSQPYTFLMRAPEQISISLISTGGGNGYDVTCHNTADGKILTEVTGGASTYSYAWTDGANTASRTNVAAGTHTLRVTDANGCLSSETITLNAPESIAFSIAEVNGINCPLGRTGILEVQSVVNAIGDIHILWSSGEQVPSITGKPAGTYSATVSDEQGCSSTRTHRLEEPLPYSVDIIAISDYHGNAIRCHGDNSGALTVIVRDESNQLVQAENYTWYKDGNELYSGVDVATVSELSAGSYRAEITYRGFCKTDKSFDLSEPQAVEATISIKSDYNGAYVRCAGAMDGSIRAMAVGGTGGYYTFLWTNGQEGADLHNIGAGTYRVTATDANGCTATAETTVPEPDSLKSTIEVLSSFNGQAISCADLADARIKASTTGGTGPFSFQWNDGQTTQALLNVPAGSYTLTTTDANGCVDIARATLANPAPVVATIAETSDYHGFGISCHGGADGYMKCAANGGTGKYTFAWDGSFHADSYFPQLSAGTYAVTVRDQNGCEGHAEGTLTQPEPLMLEIARVKNVSCHGGSDGEVVLDASGGTGSYRFSASPETWQTEPVLTQLKADTYSIRVADGNACQQLALREITQPAPVSITLQDIEPALCGAAVGKASAIVTGGTMPYRVEWSDSNVQIADAMISLSSLPSGIFDLKVSDANLCLATAPLGIPSTDGAVIESVDVQPATCSYSSDGTALLKVEGKAPFSFRWPDGQTDPGVTNLTKGEHLVEISDASGCVTVASVSVPAPDSLQVQLIEKLQPSCHGGCNGKLVVAATGGTGDYAYDWGTGQGSALTNICSKAYHVEVVDKHGCSAEATIALDEPDPIVISSVTSQPPSCPENCDGSIDLAISGGTGPLEYVWSTGQTTSTITAICAGDYQITIKDSNQCTVSNRYTLHSPQSTAIDLGGSIILCNGQTHILDPGPNWKSYAWSGSTGFKSTERQVVLTEAGTYWVHLTDEVGCIARDTFLLETSGDLLKANFLMASEAFIGDTVAMIDISWPLPETINWTFPKGMTQTDHFGDVVFGQYQNPGTYAVSLDVVLGECRDAVTKTIFISDGAALKNEGRLGYEPFVRQFNLYPNPNDGRFYVEIEFVEETSFVLTIWNILTSKKIGQLEDKGRKHYLKHVDLGPLSAGSHSLRLDHGRGSEYLRFIVR